MKTHLYWLVAAFTLSSVFGQQPLPPPPTAPAAPPGSFSQRLATIIDQASGKPEPVLKKFDLDFKGGTPKELVKAIEKASGRPLNAIIPEELAETKLPALKMNNVDVSQLFAALGMATRKSEPFQFPGYNNYQITQTSCGFRTDGRPSDDAIWYFYVERPTVPPPTKVCRFYSLASYLDDGTTVDDIITAIQTGYKMLGDTSPPTISFHKDTKLLIAVGEPTKLETIDAVLKALGPGGGGGGMMPGAMPIPRPRIARPPEKPKSD